MAGETSEKSSQRRHREISRFREKLRQRSASFSSACSYSTISTKPANLSPEIPPPVPADDASKQSHPTVDASQTTGSTKPSTSSRRQHIVSRIKRTRSSSSQRQSPLPSPAPSPLPSSAHEHNLPKVRSFSSASRPPSHPANNKYAVEGLVSRHSAGMPRVSTPTHRASPNYIMEERRRQQQQLQRRQQLPRSMPGSATIDSSISRQNSQANRRTIFHVRLSIGYMTGLKMDRIAKWARQPNNNRIVVGFVELANSGKYTALSQPLLSNVGNDAKSRITKVVWAAPRSGKDTSKARRRLHFSLQLERDAAAAESREDDDSFTSIGSYSPEVVKLLIGLKCGEEKLNLGTAKLVINGRETVEQKMDLTIQPVIGPTCGLKAKRSLLGKKQQKNSFTYGDHHYKLTPNATLRVKADIRTGSPGQDGASVWGKDDSSYTTNWTYDTSTAYPLPDKNPLMDGVMHPMTAEAMAAGLVSPTNTNTTVVDQQMVTMGMAQGKDASLFGESPTEMQYNPSVGSQRRLMHSVPPIPVVSLKKPEDKSYMSGLTGPDPGCEAPWWSMSCFPTLCGEADDLPKKELKGCTGLIDTRSFSFESLDDIGNSSSSSSSSDSSTTRMEDLKGTLIQIKNDEPIPARKPQRRPSRPRPVKSRQDDEGQVETLDVTVETYNDLKDAQETLMRYANKVGVNMEELLDEMEQSQKKEKAQNRSRRSLKI